MKKFDSEFALTSEPDSIPGFQSSSQKFCFLNLSLDVEIDGVTYHLTSGFSGNFEMGKVIDTLELERSQRKYA